MPGLASEMYRSPASFAITTSGVRGENIFYERNIPICKGIAYASYKLEYPAAEKMKYDAVIKKLNVSLHAAEGGPYDC